MLRNPLSKFNNKELVYIPLRAEKGDCPYCFSGVLRRDEEVENKFNTREGYICAQCGAVFTELFGRKFRKIASMRSREFNKYKK